MDFYTGSYLQGLGLSINITCFEDASVGAGDGDGFRLALVDALASALTKFDSLEAQFNGGRSVKDICSILIDEMQSDKDMQPCLAVSVNMETMHSHVRTSVGKAYGEWKKSSSGKESFRLSKQIRAVPLPWSSIEAYPEWVMNQIGCYINAEPEEKEESRKTLERTLLEKPVRAASIKYDGTCFGKMDNGELCGRKEILGKHCTEYLHTSTAMTESCDVAALRQRLAEMLACEVGQVCVWGELMCNPNFYRYNERGLTGTWICFGVIATLLNAGTVSSTISGELAKEGFAHSTSVNATGSVQVRLLICPALRQLLRDIGACEVAQDQFQGLSHAEVVRQGASGLREGENEGLVLVFERPNGQASLRKWKNSAEGANARQKEAQLLGDCHSLCADLVSKGKLDERIAEMVDTLRSVAEAETRPMKKGRDKLHKKAD
jgi:hypothetical protein